VSLAAVLYSDDLEVCKGFFLFLFPLIISMVAYLALKVVLLIVIFIEGLIGGAVPIVE
jgi:hypothetical protein